MEEVNAITGSKSEKLYGLDHIVFDTRPQAFRLQRDSPSSPIMVHVSGLLKHSKTVVILIAIPVITLFLSC